MKIYRNIYISILALLFSIIVFIVTIYNFELAKVSNDAELKEIEIKRGSVKSIGATLYNNNMIKNKLAFNIYVRLNKKNNLQAATYLLSENMGTKKIIDILTKGTNNKTTDEDIIFKEGINTRKVATTISKYTTNSKDDVFELLNNNEYIDSLIEKYWFLTDDIKNNKIYYPLEGYLYPNTYRIASPDASVEEIFEKMLSETDKQLTKYKTLIMSNEMSIHEILTLASIVELEGTTKEDRQGIAGVFINRLNANMNLGSDVTTYYGAKIDMGERDLYADELSQCNDYNTRCATFKKLPISPICNPSIESIEAVLEPNKNKYYYFVADKNKKIYFSKTSTEHNNTIRRIKNEGLWFEY